MKSKDPVKLSAAFVRREGVYPAGKNTKQVLIEAIIHNQI